MSTASDTVRTRSRAPLARVVTETTSPTVYCPALLISVAAGDVSQHGVTALGWGAVAALFVGVLPLAFLKLGARLGRWSDHHVTAREQRRLPFLFVIASVAAGISLLIAGGAPRNLVALVAGMLAGLAAMLMINHFWKISVHAGTTAGGAVVLGATFGVIGGVLGVVIALAAGWSRVALRDHITSQVIVGLVTGAATAAAVFLPLR